MTLYICQRLAGYNNIITVSESTFTLWLLFLASKVDHSNDGIECNQRVPQDCQWRIYESLKFTSIT